MTDRASVAAARRVRMDLSRGGYMDVNLSADASPETLAALRSIGEAALDSLGEDFEPSDSFVFATADPQTFYAQYHVPRSQVWQNSRGNQRGNVHLHVRERFDLGRIHRGPHQALCGRRAWMPRDLLPDEIATPCPRCAEIAKRAANSQASESIEPREGIVTAYDHDGRYVGCIGRETWQRLIDEERSANSHPESGDD